MEPGVLRRSLFSYLCGSRVDSLAATCRTHGYEAQDENQDCRTTG